MNFEQLNEKILEWGEDKGILTQSDARTQLLKTMEELGELASGLLKGDRDLVIDSYGDIIVTLILGANMEGLDLVDCTEIAYNEISGRKGETVDGVFIKD